MVSGSRNRVASVPLFPVFTTLTVVLSNSTGSANVILDPVEAAQSDILQIHDRATCLDQLSTGIRASRQSVTEELFVFGHEVLQLTFLSGQGVELADVELAKTFDVDGSTVLSVYVSWSTKDRMKDGAPCPSCGRIEGSTCRPRLVQGIQSSCSQKCQSKFKDKSR